jgi:hypothetical protein
MSDSRTLLLLIPYKEYERAVILAALGKCNLRLRINVRVDIIAFDQHVVCMSLRRL